MTSSGPSKSPDTRTTGSDAANVEGASRYNALWWAKVQSAGPLQVTPDTSPVAGLTRAAEPDGRTVWMLPSLPDGAGHGVLEELGTPPVAVEQPNETARVLAICVTCCWPDRSGPAWPGVTGTLAQIKAVYAGLRGRPEQSSDLTLIIGSLRRLHATGWLIWNEKAGEVRLGPRVVAWSPNQLAGLREVCRILPDPPRAVVSAPLRPEAELRDSPEDDAEAVDLPDGNAADDKVARVGGAAYRVGDRTGTTYRASAEDVAVLGGPAYGVAEDDATEGATAYGASAEDNPTGDGASYGVGCAENDAVRGRPAYGVGAEDNTTFDKAAYGMGAEDDTLGGAYGMGAEKDTTSGGAEYGANAENDTTGVAYGDQDGVDR